MGALLLFSLTIACCAAIDVQDTTVVCGNNSLVCSILLDRVFERSQFEWKTAASCGRSAFCVVLNAANSSSEGFRLRLNSNVLSIEGDSNRGLLFGVGKLLRSLTLSVNRSFSSAPVRVMRLNVDVLPLNEHVVPLVPVRAVKFGYGDQNTCWWSLESLERIIVKKEHEKRPFFFFLTQSLF